MAPILLLFLALLGCARQGLAQAPPPTAPPPEPPMTLQLTPQTVEMGAFYNGAPIRMEGLVPRGSQVIGIVRGPAKDELFNKKGRVGPIWINVDKVHMTGTPSLFLRFSSEDMHLFLDRDVIDRYELDEASVRRRMHVRTNKGDPDPAYRELIENSYLDLKKKDGTYRRVANRVTMSDAGALEHYVLTFHWPKTAPPGDYQVEVYACRDRGVVGEASTTLRLVEVGFPEFMVSLAHNHPWEYGILAVIAAMAAGFGIDAIVSRLRRPPKVRPPRGEAPQPVPPPAKVPAVHEGEHVRH